MQKPQYECEKCGQVYKMESRFAAHKCKEPKGSKPVSGIDPNFECKYCHTNYATEAGIMQHKCKTKERLDQVQTPLGQAAYLFYARWMKRTGKSIPPIATFTTSRFYESFIRFAKFNKAVQLPDVEIYVQIMVKKDIGPELWCNDKAYGIYLEHLEYQVNPNVSVKITSDTLEKLSSEYQCEIGDVFSRSNKNEIIQLIRERRLSPWILLRSSRFKQFLVSCSSEQLDMVETLIDSGYWIKRFKENPQITKMMGLYVRELGV